MAHSIALYPPVERGLVAALKDIFQGGYFVDQVLEYQFKSHKKWGSRDRKAFASALYEILRWLRPLVTESGLSWHEEWIPRSEYIARFSGLEGLASEDWEKIVATWKARSAEIQTEGVYPNLKPPELRHSLTDFLLKLIQDEANVDLDMELAALNQEAPVYLRCNTLKATPEALKQHLEEEGVETASVPGLPLALKLKERKPIFKTKSFQSGEFEMQDGGSQTIADFLMVEPGQKVVDACAGAGGKTLALSAQMKNRGRVLALDVHAGKLEELLRRARRAGISNLETRPIESTKVIKRLAAQADRLLLDVPCTGSGVLRRNPDSKWRISPFEKQALEKAQQQIISSYSAMLKTGGLLVYSTCSLLSSENETQVQNFLKSEAGQAFELDAEQRILPSQTGFDGFYMARLKKLK